MRLDIQCLRGIAITLVSVFHLFPKTFVNGFLGVDIFFVISGYLMAKNLTRTGLHSLNDFVIFYYRRILPLYYFIVFLTVIMVHLYLGDYLWENNNRYSLASLFLCTNQLVIHDQGDYFNEFRASSTSINAFLHLWSLSVEMQFYLLVPFIFFGLQHLKHDYLKLIAVSSITLIGFIAFAVINEKFAFNFMFLRPWQFSAGFIVLFWTKLGSDTLPKKVEKPSYEPIFKSMLTKDDGLIISLSIFALCLLPHQFTVLALRPAVTLATVYIINCESHDNLILSSKLLGYIGNISYVVYLVHWPVIAIFPPLSTKNYIFLIITIFVSSITIHHIFERKYLELDWKTLLPLVFILVLSNAFLQNSVREHSFWNATYPAEIQRIVSMNKAHSP